MLQGFDWPGEGGYRLDRYEVFNWGTFHEHVETVTLHGHTSLLVGENESGKSTLVDGLLALFVPPQHRDFNLAAGSDRSKKRDEISYVRGAYAAYKHDGKPEQTLYLREPGEVSVLLAVLRHIPYRRVLSFGIVYRATSATTLQKFYVLAERDLSIAHDFAHPQGYDGLKSAFKARGIRTFDMFEAYRKVVGDLLNITSKQAFILFGQLAGVKEVSNISGFVQEQMLEPPDHRRLIDGLLNGYDDLTSIRASITTAKEQLKVLKPLFDRTPPWKVAKVRVDQLKMERERLARVYARIRVEVADRMIQLAQEQVVAFKDQAQEKTDQLGQLSQQIAILSMQIENNTIHAQIDINTHRQKDARNEVAKRQQERRRWQDALAAVNLTETTSFDQILQTVHQQLSLAQETFTQAQEKERHAYVLLHDAQQAQQQCLAAIEALGKQDTNIDPRLVQVRDVIAHACHIRPTDLPFVGELLQIKPGAEPWEPAIERLLRSFATSILVAPEHYLLVKAQAETHERARQHLIYLPTSPVFQESEQHDDRVIASMIEVHPTHPFSAWLQHEIPSRFPHQCCATIEDLEQVAAGITTQGHTKHPDGIHERDDRFGLHDRRHFSLGWKTAAKRAALQAELVNVQNTVVATETGYEQMRQETATREHQCRDLEKIVAFSTFEMIDVDGAEATVEALEQEADVLHHTFKEYDEHLKEREKLRTRMQRVEKEQPAIAQEIGKWEERLAAAQKHRQTRTHAEMYVGTDDWLSIVTAKSTVEWKDYDPLATLLETLPNLQEAQEHSQRKELDELEQTIKQHDEQLLTTMLHFKTLWPEAAKDLVQALDGVDDHHALYQTVEQQGLPQLDDQFRKHVNEKLTTTILHFSRVLEDDLRRYQDNVERVNHALHAIDYGKKTILRLFCEPTANVEIREFRAALEACKPRGYTAHAFEEVVEAVSTLLLQMKTNEEWMKRVTDTRHWLNYGAVEQLRDSAEVINTYSGSGARSGGATQKLAITIMAAAIAYHYGLVGDAPDKAFRLVVVDEAFSHTDIDNSQYAMRLFEQFDLQVLVVSPAKDYRYIEPFVDRCHLVINEPTHKNDSHVGSITREDLANLVGGKHADSQ